MAKSTPLLEAPQLHGRAYARAHAAATDEWFQELVDDRLDNVDDIALIAVGGYGRGELCPFSDIDVILVHRDDLDGGDVAEALWYPVWDRGLHMGYAVVTLDQARHLLDNEFEWSTAFLDTRLVAGSQDLHAAIDELTGEIWRSNRDDLMWKLNDSVDERHRSRGDAASFIEPHLKEGRGGLRDVHALGWASRATPGFANEFIDELNADVDVLLNARVELHRLAGRAGDVLVLDNQDGVAEALDEPSTQAFMHQLSTAARRIAWRSDEAWSRWRRAQTAASPAPAGSGGARPQPQIAVEEEDLEGPLLVVGNGLLALRSDAEVQDDPLLLLQLAVAAAKTGLIMSRDSLAWLQRRGALLPEPWPDRARELFAELFMLGRPAIAIVEDLDQFGLMERLVPEWSEVHCRPQRNVFHTFTVDRHLCEAAANAADLLVHLPWSETIHRADLLVVGALFHDIGKGFPGDHTEAGIRIIGEIGERMGYPPDEVGVLVDLCRHHLLLPDVATRRDLTDPGTIKAVAAAVDSVEFIELLAALTEADSIATGPAAWGSWKAGLLNQLVSRTKHVLSGGELEELATEDFPDAEVLALMAEGQRSTVGRDTTFTVVSPDYPGVFSALSGVLAVCGLDVLDAASYAEDLPGPDDASTREPMGAFRFELQPPTSGSVDWPRVISTANQALDGRVSLRARIDRRAAEYGRYRRRLSADPPRRDVIIDNDVSDRATVIEVHASDEVGLLYSLTQVMQELRLDIRSAKIQTIGPQIVDSFYLSDQQGNKIDDPDLLAELELGLRQVIESNP